MNAEYGQFQYLYEFEPSEKRVDDLEKMGYRRVTYPVPAPIEPGWTAFLKPMADVIKQGEAKNTIKIVRIFTEAHLQHPEAEELAVLLNDGWTIVASHRGPAEDLLQSIIFVLHKFGW